MKLYIKSNSDARYLYIFKHGIGPGTIPSDVQIVKTKDLPNGYTAVWLDRFLTADELKQYDIPSETRINELLGRIDYCQKNGDVVPCGEVEACDVTATSDIGADLPTFREFATTEWEILNDGSKRLKLKDLFVYFGTDKQWNASDPGYWYEIKVGDNTYKESKKYSIDNKERCYKAMQRAVSELLQSDSIESCDNSEIDACGDTKYFANMVSASIDDSDDDKFLVEGYYDNQRQGLAESAETSDISYLNELINEYANKGYYITVHNLTDGTITEFSADNWFDDLARDGGAILFMS